MATAQNRFNDYCLNIVNDPKALHPVATNHFTVTFTLPASLRNQTHPDKPLFSENNEAAVLTLKIANDSIAEPRFSQQTITYKKGNLQIAFPGSIDAFSGTANFHVFVTKSAYDILYSWKMASGNHLTGEVGDPEDYWGETQIDITTGNKGTLVGTWLWHNVWISNLEGVTFNNNNNEPKTVNITLQYFRPEYQSGQYLE